MAKDNNGATGPKNSEGYNITPLTVKEVNANTSTPMPFSPQGPLGNSSEPNNPVH